MKEKLKQILILAGLIAVLIFPYFVFAAGDPPTAPTMKDVLGSIGDAAGYDKATDQTTFLALLGTLINVFLSLLGIIFIILIVYAGYNWMTARGEEAKLEKAKDTIWRAVIGLVITVGSYAIWNFVFTRFISQ